MPLIRCRRFYCYFDDANINVYLNNEKYYINKVGMFLNILFHKLNKFYYYIKNSFALSSSLEIVPTI